MPDIVTDISINQNWNARKGANNPVTFTFTQSAAAFNISTYTFSVQLRKFGSDTNLLNLTQGSGITNNGAAGTLNVVFTSANLTNIVANEYYWQMTVVHPDTFSYLWYQGTFRLNSETYTGDLTTSVTGTIDVNGTTINSSITLTAGSFTLTNGNGTTANGSAVDLGGTQSADVNIKSNGYNFYIGGDGSDFSEYADNVGISGKTQVRMGVQDVTFSTNYSFFSSSFLAASGMTAGDGSTEDYVSVGQKLYSPFTKGLFYWNYATGAAPSEPDLIFGVSANREFSFNLGSDATGDQYHRNASGYLVRRGTVSAASTSSLTINSDTTYQYSLTALAAALSIEAPTGTPFNGQDLLIRILDNGTARALTWNAIFRVIGVTLPTTTVINKTMYIACIYNLTDTKWDVIGVREQV